MPWKPADADKHKKGLTPKQKVAWAKVANSALKSCMKKSNKSEKSCAASAIRQANSVVGRAKEGLEDAFENNALLLLEETEPIIKTTEVDDGERRVYARLIAPGWSKNKRYYSRDALETLVPHIRSSRLNFMDHDMWLQKRLGDWASTIERGTVELLDDGIYAWLRMTENPNTVFMWKEIQKDAGAIGMSIAAWAESEDGEAEGRKGTIVKKFIGCYSVDWVYKPGAKGAFFPKKAKEGYLLDPIGEDAITFFENAEYLHGEFDNNGEDMAHWDAEMEKEPDKHLPYSISLGVLDEVNRWAAELNKDPDALRYCQEMVLNLVSSCTEEDDNGDVTFILGPPFNHVPQDETIADKSEIEFSDKSWSRVNTQSLPPSSYLIVGNPEEKSTWHLPYKDDTGKVNKGALRALSVIVTLGLFREQKLSFSIPSEVKSKIKRLLKLAGIGGKDKKETEAMEKELETKVEELTQSNTKLQEDLEKVKGDFDTLTEEKKALDEKVAELEKTSEEVVKENADLKVENATLKRQAFIEKSLREANLPEGVMKEEDVKAWENTEKWTEDAITSAINMSKRAAEKAGTTKEFPVGPKDKEKENEETKPEFDSAGFAETMKG